MEHLDSHPKWRDIFVRADETESSEEEPTGWTRDDFDKDPPADFLYGPGLGGNALLRRELGVRQQRVSISTTIRRDLQRFRSWTGASKDVLSVAWGPDDTSFAIGASTDFMDSHGIPYNRNNNLLFGNGNQLFELPDHCISRSQRPDGSVSGESYADPRLFTTVSQVSLSPHHPTLYSAGYDKVVRIWDIAQSHKYGVAPTVSLALQHEEYVDFALEMPTRSSDEPQLLATGQKSRSLPLQIFGLPSNVSSASSAELSSARVPIATLASDRAQRFSIFPSAMQWGPNHLTRHLLLTGFAESTQNDLKDREGHLLLWNVVRPQQPIQLENANENVFDIAWQPGRAVFAAATNPRNTVGLTHRSDTKSLVRTWSPTEDTRRRIYELECPARDVNELKFHVNQQLITAGCTDGRIYVWDFRMTDRLLMTLQHGQPIETFPTASREQLDVGVRFTTWTQNGRYLYTGGSDGRVCCWDVLASPEDEEVAVQEVAQLDAGIMAGTFTKDESKLLLGLVKGSVEILSVGAFQPPKANVDKLLTVGASERADTFTYVAASNEPAEEEPSAEGTPAADRARELLSSGQLVYDSSYGVGKGPNYNGPWRRNARPSDTDPSTTALSPSFGVTQFDDEVRRMGELRGGLGVGIDAGNRRNEIAKKRHEAYIVTQFVKHDRSRRSLKRLNMLRPADDQDDVQGPGTIIITSLAELALVGDDDAPRVSARRFSLAQPQSTSQPASIKTEPRPESSHKRAAGADFDLPQRKRSQTPVAGYQQAQGHFPRATSFQAGRNNASINPSPSNLWQIAPNLPPPAGQLIKAHAATVAPTNPGTTTEVDIIDLCSDSDGEAEKVRTSTATAPDSSLQQRGLTTTGGGKPANGIFTQANTPSKAFPRSPASLSRHTSLPGPEAAPRTPSRQPNRAETDSPSSQRSIIVPSSQGEMGFKIPARIIRAADP